MLKETITIDDTIKFLNELLEVDKPAMAALLTNRVPCNGNMARHRTVQVMARNGHQLGLLGVLNGLFGVLENGRGPITLTLKDGEIVEARRNVVEVAPPADDWRTGGGDGEG